MENVSPGRERRSVVRSLSLVVATLAATAAFGGQAMADTEIKVVVSGSNPIISVTGDDDVNRYVIEHYPGFGAGGSTRIYERTGAPLRIGGGCVNAVVGTQRSAMCPAISNKQGAVWVALKGGAKNQINVARCGAYLNAPGLFPCKTPSGFKGSIVAAGGVGKDIIYSGDGDDVLEGGAGGDKLYGMDGNDKLSAGPGSDTLKGGNGADWLLTLEGSEREKLINGGPPTPDPSRFQYDTGTKPELEDWGDIKPIDAVRTRGVENIAEPPPPPFQAPAVSQDDF